MSVVICLYVDEGVYAKGASAKEAFEELKDTISDSLSVDECEFFEGELFEVEVKIVRKEVPVKVKAPALPKK